MVGKGVLVKRPTKDLLIEKKLMDWTVKTIDAFFIHSVRPAVGSVVYRLESDAAG